MPQSVIGAQMFTLRDYLKTPADIAKTCQRVKEMGFDVIQVSAFGPIESEELGKILRETGLKCVATHVGLDLMKETQKCLDHHKAIDCEYAAIGSFNRPDPSGQDWIDFAKEFSAVTKPLDDGGLKVGYHNHGFEFGMYDGVRGIDMLFEHFEPHVWFEIDTYWVQFGGGDPAKLIEQAAGRIPCVHFKDMSINRKHEHKMVEIGDGNLDWPRIVEACKKSGVEWYLIERDSGEMDPFDSLKRSLENMRGMGLY